MMKMTYRDKYFDLINQRKENPLPDDVYRENHHIKPKSIYPELKDDLDNIVRLSAGEHYKAHYYLIKMYEEENNKSAYGKMLYAFNQMSRLFTTKKISDDEIDELSVLYDEIKQKFRTYRKGHEVSETTRKKIGDASRGRILSDEVKKKMSDSKKGISPTEEHRKSLSESGLQYWSNPDNKAERLKQLQSEEYRQKMSEVQKRRCQDPEVRARMSEVAKGHPGYTKGRKMSEETKRKMREAQKRRRERERQDVY